MSLPEALKTKGRSIAHALVLSVKDKQEAHRTEYGFYFQMLSTPSTMPKDGAVGTINKKTKPTDQDKTFEDFGGSISSTSEFQHTIFTYNAPKGMGWCVELCIEWEGEIWSYCENTGPQKEFGHDWQTV